MNDFSDDSYSSRQNDWRDMMLIKRQTDDTFFEVNDDVKVGRVYRVDMNTAHTAEFINQPTGKRFLAKIVNVDDGSYIPLELLQEIPVAKN